MYVYSWLPFEDWNGRLVVFGGGGLAAGRVTSLPASVAAGHASSTIKGGLPLYNTTDAQSGLWVLRKTGIWNEQLVANYSYRAIHDTSVFGKAVVRAFYRTSP